MRAFSILLGRSALILGLVALVGCAPKPAQTGLASWYGPGFAGKPTASGEPFRPAALTAAHPRLPFGTVVRVTRIDTGAHVRVVVNDRGPFAGNRIIDLSQGAARRLGMIEVGITPVEVVVVGCRRSYPACR